MVTNQLELWGGCECTINRIGDRFQNQLARRSRAERLRDLERIAELGIRTIRLPLLWEELAPRTPGEIDWPWAEALMQRVRDLGLKPIVGLMHHGSGPRYTSLVDPHFPQLLADYARQLAERFPWVEAFTPVNEPLTTARFSGLYGLWYPRGHDDATFCRALLQQVRGIVLAMRAIRTVNSDSRLVQTEDLGRILSTPTLAYQADFENERRWLTFDLLAGRLDPAGPVWNYLLWAGVTEEDLLHLLAEPCPPDILGVNHYVNSSRFLDDNLALYRPEEIGGNGRHCYADVSAVRAAAGGFSEPREVLQEAWERYRRPVAITEAHLDCTREEQLLWMYELWQAASALRSESIPVVAVTAWAIFGAFDWDSLLTSENGHYESGAFDLRAPEPRPTALAALLRTCARDGTSDHPLVRAPGWWRRPARLLSRREAHASPLRVHAPHAADGCPVLLITGASGTLGQALARLCRLRGLPYRLLDRAELDIANPASVRSALEVFHPWALVNAAGFVRVADAEREPQHCFRENTFGAATLAAACREGHTRFVTFSSDLVFDGEKGSPYVESDAVAPQGVYGRSKAAAEGAVFDALPSALIIRTSAFFGPWDTYNFVSSTVGQLARGEDVIASEDATVSPTYVPDLVHAVLNLLIDGERGVWHVANAGSVTWAGLARASAQLSGQDPTRILAAPRTHVVGSALGSERGQLLDTWESALERYFAEKITPTPTRASPADTAGVR